MRNKGDGQSGEPVIMTEEEFLNSNGAIFMAGADPALHRTPGGLPKYTKRRLLQRQATHMRDNDDHRQELRLEYAQLVESGKIRTPTRTERLVRLAGGNDDNAAVQAARRLLAKRNTGGA